MTAQATPSSNALGRSNVPSSFFAPLQTLGRYMERQKGDSSDADADTSPEDSIESRAERQAERPVEARFEAQHDERAERDLSVSARNHFDSTSASASTSTSTSTSTSKAERDQQYGRVWSLAPDRDIRFEAGHPASPQTTSEAGAAFGDQSRHGQYPAPDPEAVRGAIARLAREVQAREVQARGAGAREAEKREARSSTPASGPASPPPVTREAAFADVARRVWSEGVAGAAPSNDIHAVHAVPDIAARETVAESRVGLSEAAREVAVGGEVAGGVASPTQASPFDTSRRSATEIEPAPEPTPQPGRRPEAALAPRSGSQEAHALAHDAGNLLSALRLYSELLCFSGVLHERHRHYAEDLKLLSQRSERLIDRLLKLAEQVAAAELAGGRAGAPAQARVTNAASADPMPVSSAPSSSASSSSTPVSPMPVSPMPVSATPVLATPVLATPHISAPSGFGPGVLSVEVPGAPETASLADVLMRLRGLLGTIAHRALVVELGPEAGTRVAVPAEALERILVNLVTNAAAAIRPGGAIRIRAGATGDGGANPTLALTVDDTGCGMSEAQLRAARGEGDGETVSGGPSVSGLRNVHHVQDSGSGSGPAPSTVVEDRRHGRGLSIVRELVRAYGGRLYIDSREGTGTRIEIHWTAAANASASSRAQASAAARFGPTSELRPPAQLRPGSQLRPTPFTPEAKGAVA